ncbi:hypothetical protein SAMN03092900_0761 [Thiomicrospira sp. ALE5]|nr:hypothetical protein SAMN03092900_0761 [Thiomicrospira sp. ALE5]
MPNANLLDSLLGQIQTAAEREGVFWSKKQVLSTAKTTLGLLPSVAVWYLLLVQSYAGFFRLKN